MRPVGVIAGRMVPLDRADVDTDQIMPKQFLKRIERTGFGEFVFFDWRADPGFVLNDPRYEGANVLVAGANFGSGSSREHAPWGLQQYGFDAVIAPSFADIFRNNCAKIGLLTVTLPADVCKRLAVLATGDPEADVRIDLPAQTVTSPVGQWPFPIDPFTKHLLVEGLDDIGLTLQHTPAITAFETHRPSWLPLTSAQ
ncbi:MAG: 3-isopropylmalate dehydratase small subunit [Egibacteraceae bacterium]